MWIIVGLGNPGRPYNGTRHNLGFEVANLLAQRLNAVFRAGTGEYEFAHAAVEQTECLLVKPVTYMNNSGEAVFDVADRFETPLNHILVVCDDFQLPLGTLRFRTRGSDGGHNGLYSIIERLGSDEFPRLRCGIAGSSLPVVKSQLAAYVLDRFDDAEREIVESMISRASDAVLVAVTHGLSEAMNRYNVTPVE